MEVWDDWARLAGEQLRRGHQIQVEGRLKQDEWNDKTTGALSFLKNHANISREHKPKSKHTDKQMKH